MAAAHTHVVWATGVGSRHGLCLRPSAKEDESTFSPRGGSLVETLVRAQHERALHIVGQCAQLGVAEHVVAERKDALDGGRGREEGAIERKTRARRPHARGTWGRWSARRAAPSPCSRPYVVAVELHAAQPGCCGAEVRGETVLEAPSQLLHVGEERTGHRESMFAIASNFSFTQVATKSTQISTKLLRNTTLPRK